MCDSQNHTKEMIERAHKGDKEARNALILDNCGLIWSIVKRFLGRGYEAEDLFQIGSIGLIKAVDKFDTSYDVCFSTYAVPMIAGEIKRFLRDDGIIKVSRSIKETIVKVQKAREKLHGELGEEPRIDAIAQETGLSDEEIVMAIEASCEVESVYKTIYQSDGNEITILDRISDESCDGEKEKLVNHIVLTEVLAKLEDSEKKLIILRYFKDKTQTEVAKEMGISQVQVSRTEKKILLRLRKIMG